LSHLSKSHFNLVCVYLNLRRKGRYKLITNPVVHDVIPTLVVAIYGLYTTQVTPSLYFSAHDTSSNLIAQSEGVYHMHLVEVYYP